MIYLDNAATTKPLSEACDYARKYNEDFYFNPSARYKNGSDLSSQIKDVKSAVLKNLSANNFEVIFTSGGSESDNQAIFCGNYRGRIITTSGEHSAVYNSFMQQKALGLDVVFAKLNLDGSVNVENLLELINEKTSFVSVVAVNNETGAINDINSIANKIKKIKKDIIFHSDGVQAFGKIPLNLSEDIDLFSLSAHKIGGIKGTGCLIKNKKMHLNPLIFGGGQESGYRSGTENVFGIKAFEKAMEIKFLKIKESYEYVRNLKNLMIEKFKGLDFVLISKENGSPYILTVGFPNIRGEVLQHMCEPFDLIIGTGSACSSKNRYSRILKECGYSNEILDGVIRISFCDTNTEQEIEEASDIIRENVLKLNKVMRK